MLLILGKNSSGKSLYAEELMSALPGPLYYVATLLPRGEENARRIRRHREQRAGRGFITLERPMELGALRFAPHSAVLLEDISNLLANYMFEARDPDPVGRTLGDVAALQSKCRYLAVVSIHGLDPALYEGETRDYILRMEEANRALLALCERAVEMRNGKPETVKGEGHGLA